MLLQASDMGGRVQDNPWGWTQSGVGEEVVEVKSTTGNVKSTKTILKHPEVYHVDSAIKLGNYNVGRSGQVLTLPFYMAFLLTEY